MSQDRLFLFLRAVNLGRVNKVPMKELMAAVAADGLGKADYLLQSGNLIFPADTDNRSQRTGDLKRQLERIVMKRFNVSTAAIARTESELSTLLAENPLDTRPGGSVHVSMWDDEPDGEGWEALGAEEFGADLLHLRWREAYMSFGGASHTSRLGNALIERRLKVSATARNVRTLERLLQLPRS